MFFDSKNFGLVDAAIAMEIAETIGSAKRSPGIARHALAALINFTTAILGRSAHRDAADKTLQFNRQGFAQVSDN